MKFIRLISILIFFSGQAESKVQEVFVTANRVATSIEQVAGSVSAIQIDDSILQNYQSVSEVIRDQAGVEIFNQGGTGKVSSLFLRGANTEHTLVLIDGVEANDSMSPTRSFDFARLNLENIERIEVVKGPQSGLYGSDSLAGVINIITKKGEGANRTAVTLEGGSYNSRKLGLETGGRLKKVHYSFTTSQEQTEGFSSASSKDGNVELDGHRQISVSGRLNREIGEKSDVELIARYVDAETELDAFGGPGGDDANFEDHTRQVVTRLQGRTFSLEDRLESVAALGFNQVERENFDDPFLGDTFFTGSQWKAELLNHYYFSDAHMTSLGFEYEEERGDSTDVSDLFAANRGAFLQHQMSAGGFFMAVSGRLDNHSQTDSTSFTYRMAPGYKFADTTVRASLGSGIKNPSLFQLFDPNFGNQDLQPEGVVSWDLGVERSFLQQQAKVGVTYFDSDYTNLISFDPNTFQSINLGESRIRGLESEVQLKVRHDLQLSLNYTHLFEFENQSGSLIRRPRNSWSTKVDFALRPAFNVSAAFRHVGNRQDFDATTFAQITMPAYEVASLTGEYSWAKGRSAFLRLNNLLDKTYEEIDGFGTARFSIFGGAKLAL